MMRVNWDSSASLAHRWGRPFTLGLTLLLVAAAVPFWQARMLALHDATAIDYHSFVSYGRTWLAGEGFYRAYQLAGPYPFHDPTLVASSLTSPNYYPPPFALVCALLTVLPALLWWALPIGAVGYCLASWRPAAWTWPLLALILFWPATSVAVIVGGSTMWVTALVALGLRFRWPAVLILLKPSFLPLALIGIRHRSWWIGLAVLGAVSLALLPMWPQWITAMRNAVGSPPLYSALDLPLVLAPALAWFTRSRR
jgi:hypothetical protein